ncbi:MAG TPA: hypothetical protein DER09_09905 [Prolixibacteraceae bacterium]|nr:hypothetical protein [Prolixibacteraceae bacterium]
MLKSYKCRVTIGYNVGSYTQERIAGDLLSSRTAAVAGCALVCPHRNPNCYIVFVSVSFLFFNQ